MNRKEKVFEYLRNAGIDYECIEHPATPTVEEALKYVADAGDVCHCKNLFLRNHKGNRHYLVILNWHHSLPVHELQDKLQQGRLSFASEARMEKYLGVTPGSVSLFGLLNDTDNHVHLILDSNLDKAERLSFHPNDNTASLIISHDSFRRILADLGNTYEFMDLY